MMCVLHKYLLPGDVPTKISAVTSRFQILVVTKAISFFQKCQFYLGHVSLNWIMYLHYLS